MIRTRRFTGPDLDRMLEAGILDEDERLELIEGELIPLPPHNPPHSESIMRSNRALMTAFGSTHEVRCLLPLTVSEQDEPEPDFAVVPQHERWERHPTTAPLVMEVSDSSLAYDRGEKAGLYARARVPEYWVLDLTRRQLEVFLEPMPDENSRWGYAYRVRRTVLEPETVCPQHLPPVQLSVAELLPHR